MTFKTWRDTVTIVDTLEPSPEMLQSARELARDSANKNQAPCDVMLGEKLIETVMPDAD